MKSLHLSVKGRVQAVGFRAFAEAEANRLNVDGWVRNRRDGTVELALRGDDAAVDELVLVCRKGPRGADVKFVEITSHAGPIASGFMILSTK